MQRRQDKSTHLILHGLGVGLVDLFVIVIDFECVGVAGIVVEGLLNQNRLFLLLLLLGPTRRNQDQDQ